MEEAEEEGGEGERGRSRLSPPGPRPPAPQKTSGAAPRRLRFDARTRREKRDKKITAPNRTQLAHKHTHTHANVCYKAKTYPYVSGRVGHKHVSVRARNWENE